MNTGKQKEARLMMEIPVSIRLEEIDQIAK